MAVGLVVWPLAFGNARVEGRKGEWEHAITAEIPLGSSKGQIQAWVQRRALLLDELPQQNMIYVVVEKAPDTSWLCSEWSLILQVTMSQDHSVQQKLDSVGSCL